MSVSSAGRGLRHCPKCQTDQPLSNYTIRPNGRAIAWCKPCNAKATAAYRANNREKVLQGKRAARKHWNETASTKAILAKWGDMADEERRAVRLGVYCVTIGDKFYIGSCIDFAGRANEHVRKLRNGRHTNPKMQAAWDTSETFDMELIEACHPDELLTLEQQYIDQWFGHEDCLNMKFYAARNLV